jgi:imidazolonepropionase-like amidohydrolase
MADSRTVFTHAKLLDGERPARDGMSVVVEGNRIASVEDTAPVAREGDRVIDLRGRTLMPGMTQGHFHAGFGPCGVGNQGPMLGLDAPAAYFGVLGAKNLRTVLHSGFTSAIGSSNPFGLDVCLKDALINGIAEGPRYLACTREFMATGDQADGSNRSWFMELGNHGLVRKLDGVEQFRHATREELGRGCDVVKISISRGHGSAPAEEYTFVTDDEVRAVVEVAHDRGKRVRAHCPSKIGILMCAKAGVDIIDHADRMDEESIEAILEADATVCPSMLWSERFLQFADGWDHGSQFFPINEGFPEKLEDTLARLRGVREDYEHTKSMLPKANEAGVRLVPGDDFGFPMMPHGDYVSELQVYTKEVGIAPLDVIRWATKNGAEATGRGDALGTIEPGKLADLLVVDGDPSEDIGCLRDRLQAVMLDGEFAIERLGT